MKLYFSPGACSLASRICLHELGLDADFESVDLATKTTGSGGDYRAVNPLGYVPALETDDGRILTENLAILPFIADQRPGEIAPEAGTFDSVRLNEILGFVSTELHKGFGPLFGPLDGDQRRQVTDRLETRIDHLDQLLDDGRDHLLGERFSIADAYAFVVLSWSRMCDVSLDKWPQVSAFLKRVGRRPAVQRALEEEGLLETAA